MHFVHFKETLENSKAAQEWILKNPNTQAIILDVASDFVPGVVGREAVNELITSISGHNVSR